MSLSTARRLLAVATMAIAIITLPLTLLAQASGPAAPAAPSALSSILTLLIPALAATFGTWLFTYVNKGEALLSALPNGVKQIVVFLLGSGLTALGGVIGVATGTIDVSHLTSDNITVLIGGIGTWLLHSHAVAATAQTQLQAIATAVKAPITSTTTATSPTNAAATGSPS